MFLHTHKNEKEPQLRFQSIDQGILEISVIAVMLLVTLAVNVLESVFKADYSQDESDYYSQSNSSQDDDFTVYLICSWMKFFTYIFITILFYWFGERHFKAISEIRKRLFCFDVAKAECAFETDRVLLLRIIDELFTKQKRIHDDDDDEVVEPKITIGTVVNDNEDEQAPVDEKIPKEKFRVIK